MVFLECLTSRFEYFFTVTATTQLSLLFDWMGHFWYFKHGRLRSNNFFGDLLLDGCLGTKLIKTVMLGICCGPVKCLKTCKEFFVVYKALAILWLLMKCGDTQPMEEGAVSSEACHLSLEGPSSGDDEKSVCFRVLCYTDQPSVHGHEEDTEPHAISYEGDVCR